MTRLDRSLHIANACSSTSRRRRTTCVHPLHASRNAVDASNASSGVMRSTNRILGLDGADPDASIAGAMTTTSVRSSVRRDRARRPSRSFDDDSESIRRSLSNSQPPRRRRRPRATARRTDRRTRSGRDRVAIGSRAHASGRQRVRAVQRVNGDDACTHLFVAVVSVGRRVSWLGYSSS